MGREKRRKRGKKPTTADLNVALIKMACTRGEEEYKPRNVLFLSFFPPLLIFSLSGLLSPSLASLSSPFSFFFMSPISPSSSLFSSLPFSTSSLRRPSVYV